MKITAVCAPSGPDSGLNAVFKIVCDTLAELGEDVEAVDLSAAALTYYDGGPSDTAHELMAGLAGAGGLIFACSAVFHAPSALMHTFLEYFLDEQYQDLVRHKNCLLLTVSRGGGERAAAEQLARMLASLGAIDVVRISLDTAAADLADGRVAELVERQTEDFYRILRQNRRYILPQSRPRDEAAAPEKPKEKPAENIEDLYKKHNLDSINETAQMDINKITAMFAKKYVREEDSIAQEDAPVPFAMPFDSKPKSRAPQPAAQKTSKQLTASLPHYFNPQLAKDMEAIIQLNVLGSEGFTGHLVISAQNCVFNEGTAEKNDIVVIAESKAWTDVLKKKTTAQKAFMMGKLKVRGNFVLLTKFDQLFNKIP